MSKIYIAGHKGLVGAAVVRYLENYTGHRDIITKTHSELDLTNQTAVNNFFEKNALNILYKPQQKSEVFCPTLLMLEILLEIICLFKQTQ